MSKEKGLMIKVDPKAAAKIPSFATGDTVRIWMKITEGGKQRTTSFEGTVLKRQGAGLGSNFTLRKVLSGVGVEKTFPLFSPLITKFQVKKKGDVRRAKLYFLRQRVGRRATRVELEESAIGEVATLVHEEKRVKPEEDKAAKEAKKAAKAEKAKAAAAAGKK